MQHQVTLEYAWARSGDEVTIIVNKDDEDAHLWRLHQRRAKQKPGCEPGFLDFFFLTLSDTVLIYGKTALLAVNN